MSNLKSHDISATRPLSRIAKRTSGQSHGPITRLMSPSDFGRILKPFVFLDIFDTHGRPFSGLGLHPHSGIATVTYVAQGSVRYEDTNGATGLLRAGGIEWMRAGGGVWHGGGFGESGRTRGFQLWIALPPDLELGPSESVYLSPEVIPHDGPARILLGSYGTATSSIKAPSPMNYLAVHLKAGERWSYQPPAGHTVLWTAVGVGSVLVPNELLQGELVAFNSSNAAIEFEAQSDAEFVLGSAVPHDHNLVLGSHSVHTSTEALREAEARISEIETRLIQHDRP
ncbi:MAG TPA: pirin family protein [Terriglobales bacterium]|jgi:redox-sensitive bicupin YhaK (pirin superfamily)|nr:pirin family protein [Terriglobales bacterium]